MKYISDVSMLYKQSKTVMLCETGDNREYTDVYQLSRILNFPICPILLKMLKNIYNETYNSINSLTIEFVEHCTHARNVKNLVFFFFPSKKIYQRDWKVIARLLIETYMPYIRFPLRIIHVEH